MPGHAVSISSKVRPVHSPPDRSFIAGSIATTGRRRAAAMICAVLSALERLEEAMARTPLFRSVRAAW
jgi:hypothetical protein